MQTQQALDGGDGRGGRGGFPPFPGHRHTTHIRRYRFVFLLVSLILLLLLSPVLEGDTTGNLALTVLFTLVLLAAVFAASGRRSTLVFALLLAIPWVYLSWVHPLWRADASDLVASLLLIALSLFVLGLMLMRVIRSERVGVDTICGAIGAYLLIAVVWAVSYGVIEALVPGSFGLTDPDGASVWNQLLYFSLVTLTTVGYGDITPVGPVAQIWSVLEAVTGTLYLAVMIARLVSLYER